MGVSASRVRSPVRGELAPSGAAGLAGTRTVFARELSAWFDSSLAYVAILTGLFAVTSLFMNEFFLTGKLDMTPFFDRLPLVFVLFVPAISMRSWSEDLRTRTFELWMTLPLSAWQVVLGKFLAMLVLLCVFLAGTLPIVAMLCVLGSPDLGQIFCGYLGALLLGALFLALGMSCSSRTSDQIVAFLSAALAGFVLVFSGHPRVVAVIDGLAPALSPGTFLYDHVSALPHYESFVRGTIGLPAIVYFAGLSSVFLALSAFVVQKSRA